MSFDSVRFVLAACLFLVSGCRESTVAQVEGRIILDGQALAVDEVEGVVVVTFFLESAIDRRSDPESAIYSQDGTFSVPGKEGHGIPPGDYKIVVQQLASFAEPRSDLLLGRFSEVGTPLRFHVRLDEVNTVEIELADFLEGSK